jgi:hypothetical protein
MKHDQQEDGNKEAERMLHGIGGISAPCHAMPLLLANIPFHVNYLVE